MLVDEKIDPRLLLSKTSELAAVERTIKIKDFSLNENDVIRRSVE